MVLDPFTGSKTTNEVAEEFKRNSIGIDLYSYERKLAS